MAKHGNGRVQDSVEDSQSMDQGQAMEDYQDQAQDSDDLLASLQSELDTSEKNLTEQKVKAPRAPRAARSGGPVARKETSLADTIKRQTESPATWNYILGVRYIEQRVKAGQAEEEAREQVLADYARHVDGIRAELHEGGGSLHEANNRYFTNNLPGSTSRWQGPRQKPAAKANRAEEAVEEATEEATGESTSEPETVGAEA